MKVFIIGSGGREHALAWKLAQSPERPELHAAPGNPGIAEVAECYSTTDYVAVAQQIHPDLTIVGPELPLAAGLVDKFRQQGWPVVGPTAGASRIETSKDFAKSVMHEAGVPTARHITVACERDALAALRQFPTPVVLKADGLAAGKGVVIAFTPDEARSAATQLLSISPKLILEEYLTGEEVSFIVLTDGTRVVPFEPVQDHKAALDGDQGLNTGGMGAYSDGRILSLEAQEQIVETLIRPVLEVMRRRGHPFTGFLYAGLMMTPQGASVLEFNCRLGDPETQVLMHRLNSDLLPVLMGATSTRLSETHLAWKKEPSVCVVLAAEGYPGPTRSGDPITGIDHVENGAVFQAGTKSVENVLCTAGGRVLAVTARGLTLPQAIHNVYSEIGKIQFRGMHYRSDIGGKGLRRW